MQYMLMIYSDENCWTDKEFNECIAVSMAICEELTAQGK